MSCRLMVAFLIAALAASGIPAAAQGQKRIKKEECECKRAGATGCQCQFNSCGPTGAVSCPHRGCQKTDCICAGRMCPKFQATAECHGTKSCKDGSQHCRLAPCSEEKDRDEDQD